MFREVRNNAIKCLLPDTIRQDVSIDIGFGDVITPQPSVLDYPNLLEGFPDTNIMAYSLETIVAEKFQTVISRAEANSRMKDFYDLYTILQGDKYNAGILYDAIKATFENRQTTYQENHVVFTPEFAENSDMGIRWNAFMKKLKAPVQLTFPEVTSYLQAQLKPYWERLKQ
ncbi:MAG: nucleotidyl transferase AbiEii/AbiGii toxin family protein [Parabacteroides sp.]|nr:nucleotidyl transferase AbiEii/AbiGii toxin family protein [Parabacteroides sp.]